MKKEILFGINPVLEALKSGRREFFEVYIVKKKISERLKRVLTLAEAKKISVEWVELSQLKSLTGTDQHQGIGARTSRFPLSGISDIIDSIQPDDTNHLLLLVDNVMDPHNLGALVRTALCVGVNGIIIPKDRSVTPTPAVSKASAGALEHIRLARATNMVNTIKTLKEKGWWIAGMEKASDKSIFLSDLTGRVAIVIGGEEKGMRPLVKKHCDFLMSIPQKGPINSLNASVAGAVAMYEAFRQRHLS
ncbi:MAG: 23S rRNA (guanosine(2251)-2'-O)-methyltransferase RlmB [Desulfobacterales bacterium]